MARLDEPAQIPRKPKAVVNGKANGHSVPNGKHSLENGSDAAPQGIKRARSAEDTQPSKKAKAANAADAGDDVVVVESTGGAIVIDD